MKESLLTEKERELLYQVILDIETGGHLLHPRPKEYWDFTKVYSEAEFAENPTPKQEQMREFRRQCVDYSYWESLPEEERLF